MEWAFIKEIFEAVGFPAWAIVLLYFGIRLTGEMKKLSLNLNAYILKTESRLTKIETLLELETKYIHNHEKKEDDAR